MYQHIAPFLQLMLLRPQWSAPLHLFPMSSKRKAVIPEFHEWVLCCRHRGQTLLQRTRKSRVVAALRWKKRQIHPSSQRAWMLQIMKNQCPSSAKCPFFSLSLCSKSCFWNYWQINMTFATGAHSGWKTFCKIRQFMLL